MHTYQKAPAAQIGVLSGQRAYARLMNGAQTHYVDLRIKARLVVGGSADATAVRNGGSCLALFDEFGIDENGVVRALIDGRDAGFLTSVFARQNPARTVAAAARATYDMEDVVRIVFGDPYGVPKETAFREHNINLLLQVFAKYNADATKILNPAGGTMLTLSNVTIDVLQKADRFQGGKPFFIPSYVQQIHPVNGTNAHELEYFRTPLPLRGILVSQDTATDGAVADIIKNFALRADNGDIIGPSQAPWDLLVREGEFEYGGRVLGDSSRIFIKFTEGGALANALNPLQFVNLRADMDVAVSAGAGSSLVRFTLCQLEPDAQLCVAPPFPV